MEVHRYGAKPLTPEQEVIFEQYRQKLHQRALHGGLTSDEVRRIVVAMKANTNVSSEILQVVFDEVEKLAPGQRLLSFEPD